MNSVRLRRSKLLTLNSANRLQAALFSFIKKAALPGGLLISVFSIADRL